MLLIPQRYNFSSKSQQFFIRICSYVVVVDTTKVQFFKQITTRIQEATQYASLLLIPQRYNFSSKSQPRGTPAASILCCCWYHKGTIFQANHNYWKVAYIQKRVVVDTTKVQFFKQITTNWFAVGLHQTLLLIPQRYNFSSKSQHALVSGQFVNSCCWYHKGTIFQANHNS